MQPMRTRRQYHRLRAKDVKNAKAGQHADGQNLYLVVDPSGASRWQLQFVLRGRQRTSSSSTMCAPSSASRRSFTGRSASSASRP